MSSAQLNAICAEKAVDELFGFGVSRGPLEALCKTQLGDTPFSLMGPRSALYA